MHYEKYPSPLGTLWLVGSEQGLTRLFIGEEYTGPGEPTAPEQFAQVKKWLDAYFAGEPIAVSFPLAPKGTEFQQMIWQLLLKVPFGQTRTYGDLAREAAQIMGREKMSPQAVGQAVGRNPLWIIIPCHRIIGAGGSLTGYAGGIDKKRWLLRHEGWKE